MHSAPQSSLSAISSRRIPSLVMTRISTKSPCKERGTLLHLLAGGISHLHAGAHPSCQLPACRTQHHPPHDSPVMPGSFRCTHRVNIALAGRRKRILYQVQRLLYWQLRGGVLGGHQRCASKWCVSACLWACVHTCECRPPGCACMRSTSARRDCGWHPSIPPYPCRHQQRARCLELIV